MMFRNAESAREDEIDGRCHTGVNIEATARWIILGERVDAPTRRKVPLFDYLLGAGFAIGAVLFTYRWLNGG